MKKVLKAIYLFTVKILTIGVLGLLSGILLSIAINILTSQRNKWLDISLYLLGLCVILLFALGILQERLNYFILQKIGYNEKKDLIIKSTESEIKTSAPLEMGSWHIALFIICIVGFFFAFGYSIDAFVKGNRDLEERQKAEQDQLMNAHKRMHDSTITVLRLEIQSLRRTRDSTSPLPPKLSR